MRAKVKQSELKPAVYGVKELVDGLVDTIMDDGVKSSLQRGASAAAPVLPLLPIVAVVREEEKEAGPTDDDGTEEYKEVEEEVEGEQKGHKDAEDKEHEDEGNNGAKENDEKEEKQDNAKGEKTGGRGEEKRFTLALLLASRTCLIRLTRHHTAHYTRTSSARCIARNIVVHVRAPWHIDHQYRPTRRLAV